MWYVLYVVVLYTKAVRYFGVAYFIVAHSCVILQFGVVYLVIDFGVIIYFSVFSSECTDRHSTLADRFSGSVAVSIFVSVSVGH